METSSIVVLVVGSLLGTGGAVGFLRWWTERIQSAAENDSLIVGTAEKLLAMVNEELDHKDAQLDKMKEERALLLRYIDYIHDVLADHGIDLPRFEDWKQYAEET